MDTRHFAIILCLMCTITMVRAELREYYATDAVYSHPEETIAFWRKSNAEMLQQKLRQRANEGEAKNVVFFLGDGMGISTITGGRILKAQKERVRGGEASLNIELFPYTGLAKTYAVDMITPDSAATATAYLSGVKTNKGVLGLSGYVKRRECKQASDETNQIENIFTWAQAKGKWTGIVTNDLIVGASTAAAYAHISERDWYSSVPKDCEFKDIADQLVSGNVGKKLNLILGGGLEHFLPSTARLNKMFQNESLPINQQGLRNDGRNLVEEYLQQNSEENATFIWNREQLNSLKPLDTNKVLGLFNAQRFPYSLDARGGESNTQPTLSEMTDFAIKFLSRSPKGYLLFVENDNIDEAHHINQAVHSLDEVRQLDDAVEVALTKVNIDETLILVTADHSHGFSVNGYSSRNQSITGYATKKNVTTRIMNYVTGPGIEYPSLYKMKSAAHTAEDVAVFAVGPWAHLLTGSFENSFIPEVISYASCIGRFDNEDCCKRNQSGGSDSGSTWHRRVSSNELLVLIFAIAISVFLNNS